MTEPEKTPFSPEEQSEKPREIMQELNALKSQQGRLLRVVSDLENRLAPVLRQEEDCTKAATDATKESQTHTALSDQLREVFYGIGVAASRVEYILENMEL